MTACICGSANHSIEDCPVVEQTAIEEQDAMADEDDDEV